MSRTGWIVILATALLSASCGGKDSTDEKQDERSALGTGSAQGTVGGSSLQVKDALFGTFPLTPQYAVVVLTDRAGFCELTQKRVAPPSSASLVLMLTDTSGALVTEGDYPVWDGQGAQPEGRHARAQFVKLDAACTPALDAAQSTGASGTVTLSGIDPATGEGRGTFDLSFGPSGESLQGDFRAVACGVPVDFLAGTAVCETP